MSLAQDLLKDGGAKSRKFVLVVGLCLVMVGCWLLTARFPSLAPTFTELLGGMLAAYATYCGGNFASKWAVLSRVGKAEMPAEELVKPEVKPTPKPAGPTTPPKKALLHQEPEEEEGA